jgi:hypothetical protein
MRAIITFFNNRVKRFTIFDIKLVQGSAMIVALIFAKYIPQLLDISVWWFIAALVIISARPMYLMYGK